MTKPWRNSTRLDHFKHQRDIPFATRLKAFTSSAIHIIMWSVTKQSTERNTNFLGHANTIFANVLDQFFPSSPTAPLQLFYVIQGFPPSEMIPQKTILTPEKLQAPFSSIPYTWSRDMHTSTPPVASSTPCLVPCLRNSTFTLSYGQLPAKTPYHQHPPSLRTLVYMPQHTFKKNWTTHRAVQITHHMQMQHLLRQNRREARMP